MRTHGPSLTLAQIVEEYRREPSMAESQLAELRNMRVLLEEARLFARCLAYHRRARLEAVLGNALDEVDRHVEDLRALDGDQHWGPTRNRAEPENPRR